jgi:hypothetical protein
MYHAWRSYMRKKSLPEDLKGRGRLESVGVGGKIILK